MDISTAEFDLEDIKAVPGMVIDARGQIAIALLSNVAVGVSITRYDHLLSALDLQAVISSERWVTVYRKMGDGLFLIEPTEDDSDDEFELKTPQENEAAQFAIELALLAWPEWCPDCRKQYSTPGAHMFIPFITSGQIPEA